jgi:ribosome biogenesis GTPase / thiamine phosphate phosphatase
MELTELGLDDGIRKQAEAICRPEHRIARVTAVDRGRYLVRDERSEVPATATGKLLYSADSITDMPCVGDWVCVQYHDSDRQAVIHGLVPRKTFLRRKSAGEAVDYQVIAANVDCAFIIQSCHFDYNIRRLQRYLVMVRETQIEPVILLSKIDLVDRAAAEQMIADVRRLDDTLKVLALSNVTENGLDQVREAVQPSKTYCLLGSSGVGKTTLINHLLGEHAFETNTVSGTGEGRHTTTRRQLIRLPQGAMFVDTPGMRELGLLGASEAIDNSFADISELAPHCRFADCSHTNEPGCAVLAAIEAGTLNEDQFHDYVKLSKESEFHEMSYLDKRRKDKAFGRMVKSVKKHKSR